MGPGGAPWAAWKGEVDLGQKEVLHVEGEGAGALSFGEVSPCTHPPGDAC